MKMAQKSGGCGKCPYFKNDEKCHLRKSTNYLIDAVIRKIKE